MMKISIKSWHGSFWKIFATLIKWRLTLYHRYLQSYVRKLPTMNVFWLRFWPLPKFLYGHKNSQINNIVIRKRSSTHNLFFQHQFTYLEFKLSLCLIKLWMAIFWNAFKLIFELVFSAENDVISFCFCFTELEWYFGSKWSAIIAACSLGYPFRLDLRITFFHYNET